MEKKLQKIYLKYYKLLIPQGLQPAHYQIFLKQFIKFKCKYKHSDKKCETFGVKQEKCDDLIEYKCLSCNKSQKQKFDEKLKEGFS